jgi:predicted N-acetyltransferase YhbS
MSEEIIRLTARDFEEALDFLDFVFSVHGPADLQALLPAIYKPTDELMACNYAIKRDGRIRAIVGMYPLSWKVGDRTYKVAGIGGVTSHRRSRGAGYMRLLMDHCVQAMGDEGYHLSYLGGQRQRYQYFGYERCGCLDSFAVNKTNLRHSFQDDPGIRFEPLAAADTERLGRAMALHAAAPVRCPRAEAVFFDRLVSWQNRPWAALDAAGRMVGYLVTDRKGGRLVEMEADSDETVVRLVRAWAASRTEGDTHVDVPPWRVGLARSLGTFCESTSRQSSGNWQVIDWAGVIGALLALRGTMGPLADGIVRLGIGGYGTAEIAVSGGRASCARSSATPSVETDPLTAMRLLFGPLPPSQVLPLPGEVRLLEQWCPLPLSWPQQDGV